ncbi:lipopolysaccharide heptosyltransferase II [Candidatus Omnitrophota bacterium]
MNILQILPELNVGGVETGVRDFAGFLVKQGHKSVVVSNGGALVADLERQGSKHYSLPVHRKSPFTILQMIPKLSEIIRKENINIVHARSRVPAWIAFFACRRTRRVFITTCHGYYSAHFASRPMVWGKLAICPSQVIASHVNKDFGLPLERIRLVPRGVDLERFRFIPPDKKGSGVFNIGIIGRLSPIKGHSHFLRSIVRVIRQVNSLPVKIWIVGGASASQQNYKHDLEVLVKRLGLGYCTEFLGTQQDIPGILSDLNLLVVPSARHEAFGRVIIEAQAAGVPVIATRVGGIVDIIDDNLTGILVAPGDVEGLSRAIIRIMNDKSLSSYLAQNAYQKLKQNFTLEIMSRKTLEVYQEALVQFRVLVIKLSALGDIILTIPSLRAIRKKFPKANYKISLLVNVPYQEALFHCPYVDELIVSDLNDKDKGIRSILNFSRELKKGHFDFVIDLQNNHKSHLLSFLSHIPVRYGYRRKFGLLLNHSLPVGKMDQGPIEHQFRLLKMLDIELNSPRLELWPGRKDEAYIENFLNQQWISPRQVLVGINLSASKKWQTKAWPIEHIASLCESLSLKDIRVVFTGDADDSLRAREILDLVKGAKPVVACGKTSINQLICLIKRCQVFISSDSAPLHIAAAVGTPYVALFGPTDPGSHLASGYKGSTIHKDLACSPCYKSRCRTTECMRAIKPQEVLEAMQELLK